MPKVIENEAPDSGIYHFIFEIKKEFEVKIGAAGVFKIPAGFYIYTGTAQKNLTSRINRHIKKDKKRQWHIDYLTADKNCKFVGAYFTRGVKKIKECRFNMAILIGADFYIPRFGNSDCRYCPSHLCGFEDYNSLKKTLKTSCLNKCEKFNER